RRGATQGSPAREVGRESVRWSGRSRGAAAGAAPAGRVADAASLEPVAVSAAAAPRPGARSAHCHKRKRPQREAAADGEAIALSGRYLRIPGMSADAVKRMRRAEWARRDSNPGPLLCESSALTS